MRPFQWDPSQVDTSMFDKMLQTKQQQIANTRGLAQNNYNISNKNLGDMYSAFQQHLSDQLPSIQQRYQQSGQDIGNTFDSGINQNNQRLSDYNAQKAEMLQRLGIQAAANAPDLVGQEIQRGNNALQQSKTTRQATNEADSQNQQNWFQNMNALAGNEGVQRKADLQKQLNDIFNNLDNAGLQAQTDNDQAKLGYIQQMFGNAFNNYQNERDFNEKALEAYNKYQTEAATAQAKLGIYQSRYGGNNQNPATQGIIGLNQAYDPSVIQAFQQVLGQGKDPSQVAQFYQTFVNNNKNNTVDPGAFLQYLTGYNNLGKTNNFPIDFMDPSQ